MKTEKRYHCCASCEHFRIEKQEQGVSYRCSRLGYETKPDWQFHCWTPREQVKRLMQREQQN